MSPEGSPLRRRKKKFNEKHQFTLQQAAKLFNGTFFSDEEE